MGLKNAYLALRQSENYENPNTLFSIACAFAALGYIKKALKYATETYDLCKSIEREEPNREWIIAKIELSNKLIDALKTGSYENLLQDWRNYSVTNLMLEKL